jgi:hypothetical protein
MLHSTLPPGVLPSLAVTVTVAIGVCPEKTGVGANVAVVDVAICPKADAVPVAKVSVARTYQTALRTKDLNLSLKMSTPRESNEAYYI